MNEMLFFPVLSGSFQIFMIQIELEVFSNGTFFVLCFYIYISLEFSIIGML